MYRYIILYLQFVALIELFYLLSCNPGKEKENSRLFESLVDLKATTQCSNVTEGGHKYAFITRNILLTILT